MADQAELKYLEFDVWEYLIIVDVITYWLYTLLSVIDLSGKYKFSLQVLSVIHLSGKSTFSLRDIYKSVSNSKYPPEF